MLSSDLERFETMTGLALTASAGPAFMVGPSPDFRTGAMPLTAAHAFIRRTASDPALRATVAALGDDASLDQLVALGARAGLHFDAAALRAAWRQDWMLRWLAASANGSDAGNRESSARASFE